MPSTFLGLSRPPRGPFHIAGIPLDIGTTNRSRRALRSGGHPAGQPHAGRRRPPRIGSIRRRCRSPTSAISPIALGDIAASLRLIERAGGRARASGRARRRARDHPAAAAGLARQGGAARAGAFRCACRHLAGQFRPALRARLGVLPRDRGRPDRPAAHHPDRHPLPGAARGAGTGRSHRESRSCPAQDVHESGPRGRGERIRDVVGDGAGLSELRHRCAGPGLRARHRHAGDRWAGGLAGPGDPAPARGLRFAGMDVVEVAPAYDVAEITALAAATIDLGVPRAARPSASSRVTATPPEAGCQAPRFRSRLRPAISSRRAAISPLRRSPHPPSRRPARRRSWRSSP